MADVAIWSTSDGVIGMWKAFPGAGGGWSCRSTLHLFINKSCNGLIMCKHEPGKRKVFPFSSESPLLLLCLLNQIIRVLLILLLDLCFSVNNIASPILHFQVECFSKTTVLWILFVWYVRMDLISFMIHMLSYWNLQIINYIMVWFCWQVKRWSKFNDLCAQN